MVTNRRRSTKASGTTLPGASDRRCPDCSRVYPESANFCTFDGTTLPVPNADKDPRIGTNVDEDLQLVARVGKGGLGTVYRATHAKLGKDVAVKLMHPSVSADPTSAQRFLREARVTRSVSHENIVQVFDCGRTEAGELYIVMELLEGRTLATMLEGVRHLEPERAVRLIAQVCDGLQYAHDFGLIHRDLKPENIFVTGTESGGETAKILDFGLARDTTSREKLTRAGVLCGTPEYVSPEQAHGRELDGRSDIYAIGVVLYELLTGRVPFTGPSMLDVLVAHANEPPAPMAKQRPSSTIPYGVERAVLRALSKAPDDRPKTAHAFKHLLLASLGDVPPAESDSVISQSEERPRIRRQHETRSRAETVIRQSAFDAAPVPEEPEAQPSAQNAPTVMFNTEDLPPSHRAPEPPRESTAIVARVAVPAKAPDTLIVRRSELGEALAKLGGRTKVMLAIGAAAIILPAWLAVILTT